MDLPSKKVFEALLKKGVDKLHHANSVLTSCQFLRQNAFLSRGTVERRKLFQTTQSSDADDRKFNVWFDVFTDSVDIHARSGRPNVYGPVLFIINVEALRKTWTGRIWITKANPIRWSGLSEEERWFRSIEEIEADFQYGTFEQMIVFRHCGGELPFKDAVTEIILDDPKIRTPKNDVELYSVAFGALQLASFEGGLSIPILRRECAGGCKCQELFREHFKRTAEMFAPRLRRVG